MNVFSLAFGVLGHIGLLLHTEKDVETIVKEIFVAHTEKFPTAAEVQILINDAEAILDSGLIPVSADVKAQITSVLNGLLNAASGTPDVPPPTAAPTAA